jgi:hypothetical protein
MMITAAMAAVDPKLDHSNKENFACDADAIELEINSMLDQAGRTGLKVVYVKDVKETSRTSEELRCKVTMVTNKMIEIPGIFRFFNKDGHNLVNFQPGSAE